MTISGHKPETSLRALQHRRAERLEEAARKLEMSPRREREALEKSGASAWYSISIRWGVRE